MVSTLTAFLHQYTMVTKLLAAVGALVYVGLPVSGGHINPAVSLGLFLDKRISVLRLFLYWAAQFIGGIAGGGMEHRKRPDQEIMVVDWLIT